MPAVLLLAGVCFLVGSTDRRACATLTPAVCYQPLPLTPPPPLDLPAALPPSQFGACNPKAPGKQGEVPLSSGNTFYVPMTHPNASAHFQCGPTDLTVAEAQAVGYELGSTAKDSLAISPDAIAAMIRAKLGF